MAENEESGKFGWFVAGAAVGVLLGFLFAPKSGKETREFISQKTGEGREALSGTGRELFDRSREIYDKGREIADDAASLFERGKKLMRGDQPARD